MLRPVRREQQCFGTGSDVGRLRLPSPIRLVRGNPRIGSGDSMQQHAANGHTERGAARFARNHAFTPLRFDMRTQSLDLRGLAYAVDAFERNEHALHIHHCTVTPHRSAPVLDPAQIDRNQRAGTTSGREYPSLAVSQSISALTVVAVDPISFAIRVFAQP